MTRHILTVEDPIEYVFTNRMSLINQRKVGSDTTSLMPGLKNALLQAPDAIMIGEIRDRQTMDTAVAYAQSGHLCLTTLCANDSHQALNRILSFYPVEVRHTLLRNLPSALNSIVSQRLVKGINGTLLPAVEVLLNTTLISEMIEKGDFTGVKEAIENSMTEGSQTFEADLERLIVNRQVDHKEGI